MGYKNGKDILPEYLLKAVQEFVQGETIYIPKEDDNRARWGELSGARELYQTRNMKIHRQYNKGVPIEKLMVQYNLSEESIRKIVYG